MRHSSWLAGVARAFAVVGALGLGGSMAWADEESELDREQIRSEQNSDDSDDSDSSSRTSRSGRSQSEDSDDSDSNRSSRSSDSRSSRSSDESDSERSSRSTRSSDDSDRSSRGARSTRNSDESDDTSDRRSRTSRSSRNDQSDDTSDRSSRSSQSRRDQSRDSQDDERSASRGQQREVGAEFDTDDEDRLVVSNIEDESLASRAGLKEDDVIISVDGRRFNDSRQLDRYLSQAGSRRVPIIIERDGRRYTVTLNQQGQQRQQWQNQSQEEDVAWLGVYLDDNENGPVITQVYPSGPAARAGLRTGDVIVQFDGYDVTDSDELVEWIEKEDPNSRVDFTVLRNGREFELSATLASRNQFVYRGQNQGSRNESFADRSQRSIDPRRSSDFERYDDQRYSDQRRYQDDQYTEYRGGRNEENGYRTYSSAPRSGQTGQSSQRIERLEQMVRELSEEVRDLRRQIDNE